MYATLVPVMGGVAYASASELDFNLLQARPDTMRSQYDVIGEDMM